LLVGVGVAVTFFSRRGVAKSLGQAILGFGLIFLGMKVMNDGLVPLASNELTRQVLVALAGNPFLGVVVGAALSAGMASSAATIGLLLSLAQQRLLPLDGAIPVVLGANIGTCAQGAGRRPRLPVHRAPGPAGRPHRRRRRPADRQHP